MYGTSLELLGIVVGGRQDTARPRYFAEIEEDLDHHLQQLIDLAIADEQAEVSKVDQQTATLARELIAIVAITTVIAIAASVGAVLLLSRALGIAKFQAPDPAVTWASLIARRHRATENLFDQKQK